MTITACPADVLTVTFRPDSAVDGPDLPPVDVRRGVTVLNRPVELSVRTSAAPTRLTDLVLLARRLATGIGRLARDYAQLEGRPPACCRGCAACCSFLVPITAPEAVRLGEEIASLPPKRRQRVEAAFTEAERRILATPPPTWSDPDAPIEAIADWYRGLDVPCPLLVGSLCTWYERRPTVCREFLASDPEACAGGMDEKGAKIEYGVSVAEALARTTANLLRTEIESVMLPLALSWADGHKKAYERTWPADQLARELLAQI